MSNPPPDPFAIFRDAVDQWEKAANEIGSKFLQSEQAVELMHKGTAATMMMQSKMRENMNKALSAASMPNKDDFDGIAARLGEIDQRLARIEALLAGSASVAKAAAPKPKRTRKPPSGS
jgi:hypothetical protein